MSRLSHCLPQARVTTGSAISLDSGYAGSFNPAMLLSIFLLLAMGAALLAVAPSPNRDRMEQSFRGKGMKNSALAAGGLRTGSNTSENDARAETMFFRTGNVSATVTADRDPIGFYTLTARVQNITGTTFAFADGVFGVNGGPPNVIFGTMPDGNPMTLANFYCFLETFDATCFFPNFAPGQTALYTATGAMTGTATWEFRANINDGSGPTEDFQAFGSLPDSPGPVDIILGSPIISDTQGLAPGQIPSDVPSDILFPISNPGTATETLGVGGGVWGSGADNARIELGDLPCGRVTTPGAVQFTCDAPVPGGGTSNLRIIVTPTVPGVLNTQVEVFPQSEDPNPENNTFFGDFVAIELADLSIMKEVSTPNAPAGVPFGYTLEIRNDGPSTARNVLITDTLPVNMEIQNPGALPPGVSVDGQTIQWNPGLITSALTSTLAYTTIYTAPVLTPTIVVNVAVATDAPGEDPTPGNNEGMIPIEIVSLSLTGKVYNDFNVDSFFDVTVDLGLPDVEVFVDQDQDGQMDPSEPSAMTDSNGDYDLRGVLPGSFELRIVPPPMFVAPPPIPIEIVSLDLAGLDFPIFQPGEITGISYDDRDGDGIQGVGETGLSGWTIQLSGVGGTITQTTGMNGSYIFPNVMPGPVTLSEQQQPGWVQTAPDGGVYEVFLGSGQTIQDLDFGNWIPPNPGLHGRKFLDINGDGILVGDPGLNGVTINLKDNTGAVVQQTRTMWDDLNKDGLHDPQAEDGWYWFDDVPPGTYTIEEVVPTGMTQTFPDAPGTHSVVVTPGVVIDGLFNFGNTADRLDWGDLPEPRANLVSPCPLGKDKCYRTTSANFGPSHVISDFWLGDVIDGEADGQPTALADGDDLNPFPFGPDDEDGFLGPPSIQTDGGLQFQVIVTNPSNRPAFVDIWVDLNDDGVLNSGVLPAPALLENVVVAFPTPASGIYTINTGPLTPPLQTNETIGFVRMRISSIGGLPPTGPAPDGEVEDWQFFGVDYGDAPESEDPNRPNFPWGYPTRLAVNGARHLVVDQVRLGASIDPDPDGVPSTLADGDDELVEDDEDGVVFGDGIRGARLSITPGSSALTTVPSMTPGTAVKYIFFPSTNGMLDGWVDWNRDGDWDDSGERIFSGEPISPSLDTFDSAIPAGASPGFTYARFRFSRLGVQSYTGPAPDGEVEDYLVVIQRTHGVNSTGDEPDNNPGDGICDTGTGQCTLRAAIQEHNAGRGPGRIHFSQLSKRTAILSPGSELPPFEVPIVLDGGGILELDGSSAGSGSNGITIQAGGSAIQNTVIRSFDGHGVVIESGDGTTVSGSTVTGNGGDGVRILDGSMNEIRNNSIFGNGGLGIDLGGDGVSPNDGDDSDTGANGLQNYPGITVVTAENARISGSLSSTANTMFAVEFFVSEVCDASGNGEGQTFVGSLIAQTGSGGSVDFEFSGSTPFVIGSGIAATATDPEGNTSEFSTCVQAITTDVEPDEDAAIPKRYVLYQNYPNPFNPVTTIRYVIPASEHVTIEIFDALGQRVRTVVSKVQNSGTHEVTFDAADLPSGIYLYRMTTRSFTDVKMLTLLK